MKISKLDTNKYLLALIDYTREGKITKKEQVEMILEVGKVSVKEFVDWLFDSIGKSVTFNDLSKLIDIGMLPKTFVTRKLKYEDKFDRAPESFQEKYASILDRIAFLERKIK